MKRQVPLWPLMVDGWAKVSEIASNRADPPVMPWPIQPMTCPPAGEQAECAADKVCDQLRAYGAIAAAQRHPQ